MKYWGTIRKKKNSGGNTGTHFLPKIIQRSRAGNKSPADSSLETAVGNTAHTWPTNQISLGVLSLLDTARLLLSTRDTLSQHRYEIVPIPAESFSQLSTSHRDDEDLSRLAGKFAHYTRAGAVAPHARSSQF